ncbi:MAG: hypothetical protein HQK53_02025 [Oligoflexia bacterium]|nr:hypothetical protein [Oligoflexia bacterium]
MQLSKNFSLKLSNSTNLVAFTLTFVFTIFNTFSICSSVYGSSESAISNDQSSFAEKIEKEIDQHLWQLKKITGVDIVATAPEHTREALIVLATTVLKDNKRDSKIGSTSNEYVETVEMLKEKFGVNATEEAENILKAMLMNALLERITNTFITRN